MSELSVERRETTVELSYSRITRAQEAWEALDEIANLVDIAKYRGEKTWGPAATLKILSDLLCKSLLEGVDLPKEKYVRDDPSPNANEAENGLKLNQQSSERPN